VQASARRLKYYSPESSRSIGGTVEPPCRVIVWASLAWARPEPAPDRGSTEAEKMDLPFPFRPQSHVRRSLTRARAARLVGARRRANPNARAVVSSSSRATAYGFTPWPWAMERERALDTRCAANVCHVRAAHVGDLLSRRTLRRNSFWDGGEWLGWANAQGSPPERAQ
jgi:hypothetical protein